MGENASIGKRIAGGLIDLVVTFILILLLGWITGLGTTTSGTEGASINVDTGPFLGLGLVVFLLFTVMEAQLGKTPGKMMVGTKVVDAEGQPINFVAALIRNLFRYIDGIAFYIVGLIIIAIDKENRRLGDMVAKTRVVNA